MKLKVLNMNGEDTKSKVLLDDSVFGIEPNEHVMYMAVRSELWNMRQGTHSSKGRSDARGGGRKPWKQKGRGTARAGTRRSPIWVGGGKAFGPKPHDYQMDLPKKVKRLARRSVLSQFAKEKKIMVVDEFSFAEPKTKAFISMLQNLEIDGKKVMVLISHGDKNLYLSARNIYQIDVVSAQNASTYDLIDNDVLLCDRGAIENLNSILSTNKAES